MANTMKQTTLCMAPLKGITDHVFRNTFADHFSGFDLAVAPFIASRRDSVMKRKHIKDLLPENNDRLPVVPQIMSKTAKEFIVLADYLYSVGYDTVNWNLGCPFPAVAKKGRGAGMLPHTEMIRAFLDTVVSGIKGALSIKVRLGWRRTDDIFRLLPVFNQFPLKEIIIHPRTGVQRYEGTVDLDAFETCLGLIDHPVVYNGDMKTLRDFNTLSERFPGVGRWMIGRWCISNPFLPLIIKTGQDCIPDKIQRMKRFHAALYDAYGAVLDGPSHLLNKMKGIWCYMTLPLTECKKTMKKIKKSTRPDQYLDRVNGFFDTEAASVLYRG